MNRAAKYATLIVVAHLFMNIAHGLAHRALRVGLTPLGSAFEIVVVLAFPLIAVALVWTTKKRQTPVRAVLECKRLVWPANRAAHGITNLRSLFYTASPSVVYKPCEPLAPLSYSSPP